LRDEFHYGPARIAWYVTRQVGKISSNGPSNFGRDRNGIGSCFLVSFIVTHNHNAALTLPLGSTPVAILEGCALFLAERGRFDLFTYAALIGGADELEIRHLRGSICRHSFGV